MNETVNQTSYKYFAFISYKREDIRWGLWVQKMLQSYRLPVKVCREHIGIPKQLNPIFIDIMHLTPGHLAENLKKEIQESKYFISICSKHCKEDPYYIDQELSFFLETHDSSMVIPFIIDDSDAPEEDCFSPQMSQFCMQNDIVGVNIHEAGKKVALI